MTRKKNKEVERYVTSKDFQKFENEVDEQIMHLKACVRDLQKESKPKYILWFESTLSDETMEKIKSALTELEITGKVISGVKSPTLVTFE